MASRSIIATRYLMPDTQRPSQPPATKARLSRRLLLQASAAASFAALGGAAFAQSPSAGEKGGAPKGVPKQIRIAYQRGGILVIAQQQKALEKFFQPRGIEVVWKVFPYSNPALEAINVGSIDFSSSGN